MNREIQRKNTRRSMSRTHGGGYGMGAPLVSQPSGPGSDWTFAVKQPVNQGFDDCLFPARPGQLFNMPDPATAQAGWPLRGGKRGRRTSRRYRVRKQRGGHLSDADIVIDASFYGYDEENNQIIKFMIEDIEGDEVRVWNSARGGSEIFEKAELLNVPKYDAQLGNLTSLHPDAAIIDDDGQNAATEPIGANNNNGSVASGNTEIVPPSNNPANNPAHPAFYHTAGTETAPANNNPANNPAHPAYYHSGGGYDSLEMSHAYRHNGWDQALTHGSGATAWGRDTGLAQTVMAGGFRKAKSTLRPTSAQRKRVAGGSRDPIEASHAYPPNGWETQSTHGGSAPTYGVNTGLAQTAFAGGRRRRSAKRRGTRRRTQRGGGCGCSGSKLFGGSRRRGTRRTQRGGASNGYAIDPSVSIGGSGPNVDAIRTGVPCDPRAGAAAASEGPADPRAYGVGYSLTPNSTVPSVQAGGAYSTGNAYPDSCYKAPGSMLPVYPAQTAGFNFAPSTATGGTLPDGVTAYNEVVPYAARMGGGRRRKSRKGRKARKGRKGSRKH